MQKRNVRFCALATMALGLGLTGCFGETIISAGAKVAGGQIASLTSGEIKLLNEAVVGVLATTNPGFTAEPLTDEQATALSDFLKANNLNTLEDFEALQQTAESNPESLEGLDALATAFNNGEGINVEDFDFDQILSALFGTGGGTGGLGGSTGNSGNTGGAN